MDKAGFCKVPGCERPGPHAKEMCRSPHYQDLHMKLKAVPGGVKE